MFTICSTRLEVCATKQYRISQSNSTKWAQSPSSQKREFDSKHRVVSRLFHIDDVLTSQRALCSLKWIKGRQTRGRKKNENSKEKREKICSGFTLREALSWMANVAELMPVSSGTSKGLVTSALWRVTTTKRGIAEKWNETWCFM